MAVPETFVPCLFFKEKVLKTQKITNRILIADDERSVRVLLTQFLAKRGYELFEAADGYETIEKVDEHLPNILLLDRNMPGQDGLEVCRELRQGSHHPLLYIVLFSAHQGAEEIEKGRQVGADAYLTKPCDLTLLLETIEEGFKSLEEKSRASLDPLTNLFNQNHFGVTLERLAARINAGTDDPCTVLMLDLDHFKDVIETFGEELAEVALKTYSQLLGEVTRKYDLPCRWEADRFMMLLPETDLDAAEMIALRIQKQTDELEVEGGLKLSVTIGIARFKQDSSELVERVKRALDAAKSEGRGGVKIL